MTASGTDSPPAGDTEAEKTQLEGQAGATSFLEEVVEDLPGTHGDAPMVGDTVTVGGRDYSIAAQLRDSWCRAVDTEGEPVTLKLGCSAHASILGDEPLTARLVTYCGPDGLVLGESGTPLQIPVDDASLVALASALAGFVVSLADHNLALIDLDPTAIVKCDGEFALARWPAVVEIGAALPVRWREGISPPELAAGGTATGGEGLYMLGAVLLWVSGEPLGPEGLVSVPPGLATLPGIPQLLEATLGGPSQRMAADDLPPLMGWIAGSTPPQLILAGASTIGCNPDRKRNEDSYAMAVHAVSSADGERNVTRIVVADGMGGMEAGDEASQAAVAAFTSGRAPDDLRGDALADWAIELGWEANDAVLDRLRGRNGGSTLTGLVFDGARYALVHVGDSRAYLSEGGQVRVITKDHSLAAAMVASGEIEESELAGHPDRNQLLRSLGDQRNHRPGYFFSFNAEDGRTNVLGVGQTIALMTDGVWDVVDTETIRAAMSDPDRDPQTLADGLVQAAVRGGAPDNATVAVARRVR